MMVWKKARDFSWQRGSGEDNRLFALYPIGSTQNGHAIWRFRCDCGRLTDLPAHEVFRSAESRSVKSCGKCRRYQTDFSWRRGNGEGSRLFALYFTGKFNDCRNAIWLFRCDCGALKELAAIYAFRTSRPVLSCGCLGHEREIGGHKMKPEKLRQKVGDGVARAHRNSELQDLGYVSRTVYVDGKPIQRLVYKG